MYPQRASQTNSIPQVPKLLVLLRNKANQNLIEQQLSEKYQILDNTDDILYEQGLDLCIIDLHFLEGAKEFISRLKKESAPIQFPVTLLVEDSSWIYGIKDLWLYVDDVITTPLPINIFKSRIESQIQNRRYSQEILNNKDELSLYHEAINSTMTGIVITDARAEDMPLVFCNDGFLIMTGYQREEVLGRNCRFLQANGNDINVQKEIQNIIDNQLSEKRIIRNFKKDGTEFWNELSIAPIKNAKGEITHYVGIQNDVTELLKIQEQLSDSLAEKVVLLQEIHHRVKNNLAIVSGLLWLEMNDFKGTNSEQELPLTRSINRIHSMAKVHELLYKSSSLSHVMADEYVEDLGKTIMSNLSDSKHINLSLNIEKEEMNINEVVPLGLMLNELITNSLKYAFTENTGEIHISLYKENNYFHVCYRDTGNGFNEEFDVETATTLGIRIILVLLSQLQAKYDFVTFNEFKLNFSFEAISKGSHSNMKKEDEHY